MGRATLERQKDRNKFLQFDDPTEDTSKPVLFIACQGLMKPDLHRTKSHCCEIGVQISAV